MDKWEYKWVSRDDVGPNTFNTLGSQGWELVVLSEFVEMSGWINRTAVFKRMLA